MATFKVSKIIDGDTFSVAGGWRWNGRSGDHVRPTGYDAPELPSREGFAAKQQLEDLILGKQVDLTNPATVDRGRLVCDVFFNGKPLKEYFPEYQT